MIAVNAVFQFQNPFVQCFGLLANPTRFFRKLGKVSAQFLALFPAFAAVGHLDTTNERAEPAAT